MEAHSSSNRFRKVTVLAVNIDKGRRAEGPRIGVRGEEKESMEVLGETDVGAMKEEVEGLEWSGLDFMGEKDEEKEGWDVVIVLLVGMTEVTSM
mmetsp:Transcript_4075/g.7844  ORF Transcript_4075/g.7844 Transcript_4075/m.7844 type:complete len:94 (-) Transcript_4075:1867-2148(-)